MAATVIREFISNASVRTALYAFAAMCQPPVDIDPRKRIEEIRAGREKSEETAPQIKSKAEMLVHTRSR
jgi:hypothetical protein